MRELPVFIILLFSLIYNTSFINAQNTCASAINIDMQIYGTCGDMFFTNVNFSGATTSSDLPAPTCGDFNSSTKDMWYRFIIPNGVNELAFHAFNSPTPMMAIPPFIPGSPACAPGMAVYRGSCGNLSLIDCYNANSGFLTNGEIRWKVLAVTPGETIYVRLWEKTNNETSMFFAASVITSLPEADCNNPPVLTSTGCNILAPAGTIPAPDACGWTSTDNVVFYSFEVLPTDPQPVVIEIEYGQCWGNETGGLLPSNPEIQFAVYSWNGVNCNGIGGGPTSDPPNTNTTTYQGCANGVGAVTYSHNLPPGQYVLAMDGFSSMSGNSLCIFGIEASFIDPVTDVLLVNLTTSPNSCIEHGGANITILNSCNPNPTINWSTGATGLSVSNLEAGNYSVTVTDASPCNDTIINFSIIDQTYFAIDITSIGNACVEPVQLTANVDGGNPADVSFVWNTSPVQTTQSISVSSGGTYSVTATYGNCEDQASIEIIGGDFDFEIDYSPSICEGNSGFAQFSLITGTGPFNYLWSTGSTQDNISITSPGEYCLTVTDMASLCQLSKCVNVNIFPSFNINVTTSDLVCYNEHNGSATATVSGGAPEFTYNWDGVIAGSSVSNLGQGEHTLIVTDANSCSSTTSFVINSPPELIANISQDQGICYGEQAVINVNVSGGVPPYTYFWSDDPNNHDTERTVQPESTSQYTVNVYDANNCEVTAQTTISVSQPIVLDINVTNNICYGVCDGSANINITGGTAPFTFSWESNTETWTGICVGSYSVTVTDANACSSEANFEISESANEKLLSNFVDINNVSCFGFSDANANVIPNGGTPPYNVNWQNEVEQDGFIGLNMPANIYFYITVTDANNCHYLDSIKFSQPPILELSGNTNPIICGESGGIGTVHASGGTPPYEYLWQNNETTETATELSYGQNFVTVTDANNCSESLNLFVNMTGIIYGNFIILQENLCYNDSIATIKAVFDKGRAPFTYSWSNGQTDSIATGFPAGEHYVYISDKYNCSDSVHFIITEPDSLIPNFTIKQPSCTGIYDGSIDANPSGASPYYTYLWNNNSTDSIITKITDGIYYVSITDSNDCEYAYEIELVESDFCLVFYNTITPNGDGENDTWIIKNIEKIPRNEVWIYNRIGNLIYYAKEYQNDWDGTYNGKDVPEGTYYYIVSTGTWEEPYKGHITVIR
ncbi:MAG: gliding motility-associated C-terminal domain-containing protein [Bacteroidales bacterium]|jgi:gliding motility-associated-like protein|nr:gliding motility-associated C-terminal domain-containing protein [Bacteroidales bacterium]